jgi:hypothetical protein
MSEFRIYQHPAQQLEAVKQGWSWPGAIFVAFWALYKKLWVIGGSVLTASVLLHVMLPFSSLPFFFDLACAGVFGYFGNEWREKDLADRGFEPTDSVESSTPDGAVAEHLRNQVRDGGGGGSNFGTRLRRVEPIFRANERP